MTGRERSLFRGAPSRSRINGFGWGVAISGIVSATGCALIGNLGQFDGAIAADATAEGAASDALIATDDAADALADDATETSEASLDAGPDTVMDASGADSATDAHEAGVCGSTWPEGGTNLVADPDFVEAGAGWSALYGGLLSVTSVGAYCGTSCGELSGRSAFFNAMAATIPPNAGNYTVSAWVRQDGAASVSMDIGGVCILGDGGTFYPQGPQAMVSPNTWTLLTGTMSVPADCTSLQVFVGQPTSATAPFPDLFADDMYVGL